MGNFLIHTDTGQELILEHHGILGQKWGVRNGPPYPLSEEKHNSSERKAGYKKSLSGNADVKDAGSFHRNKNKKNSQQKPVGPIGKSGFAEIQGGSESVQESLDYVNPHRNTKTSLVTPYNMNCGNCAIAYELRRRGLDVEARGNNQGMTAYSVSKFFDNAEMDDISKFKTQKLSDADLANLMFFGKSSKAKERADSIKSELSEYILSKYPDNSRGAIAMYSPLGGHWMNWEVRGNSVVITDAQSNIDNVMENKYYINTFGAAESSCIIRTDNRRLSNDINKVVMSRGSNADANGMEFDVHADNPVRNKREEREVEERRKAIIRTRGNAWDGTWQSYNPYNQKYKNKV